MVLADMQAEPVPQDACFGGRAKAMQRFTVFYSYMLIVFLALIMVLWLLGGTPHLIAAVQKRRRKRRCGVWWFVSQAGRRGGVRKGSTTCLATHSVT
jgi:hypothetical protein